MITPKGGAFSVCQAGIAVPRVSCDEAPTGLEMPDHEKPGPATMPARHCPPRAAGLVSGRAAGPKD